MDHLLQQLGLFGIIPVVVIDNEENAAPLADALIEAGLPCIEITLRTGAGLRAIAAVKQHAPGMVIGAGTVLTVDQAKAALDSGAQWIASPGFNRKVVDFCIARNVPITPGVATPTEAEMAVDAGLNVVKFFPAEQSGGAGYLKALAGPYHNMKFIPTGGVSEENVMAYLKTPGVLAVGGSWMVKSDLIAGKNFDQVRVLTERAIKKMLAFELRHVGMNMADASRTPEVATRLAEVFGLLQRDTPGSIFVGTEFEVLKRVYLGRNGHIAIGTQFIDRAVDYMQRRGIMMDAETQNIQDGRLHAIYFAEEIGGFAFHFLQV
jgi:2-dehydro-3-deoxyphosphogluconate aldolase/(4S)-4-hydroxy-2-oxoglutarate aldolase